MKKILLVVLVLMGMDSAYGASGAPAKRAQGGPPIVDRGNPSTRPVGEVDPCLPVGARVAKIPRRATVGEGKGCTGKPAGGAAVRGQQSQGRVVAPGASSRGTIRNRAYGQ